MPLHWAIMSKEGILRHEFALAAVPATLSAPFEPALATAPPMLPSITPVPSKPEPPIVLVLDNTSAHVDERVQTLAYKIGVRLVMLPPTMTSVLKPLDAGVNKIAKNNMRRYFMKHLENMQDMQDDRSLPLPTPQQVSRWALQAWSDIPRDLIVKAWQRALFTFIDQASEDLPEDSETDFEAAQQPQPIEIEEHAQTALGFDDEELVEQM